MAYGRPSFLVVLLDDAPALDLAAYTADPGITGDASEWLAMSGCTMRRAYAQSLNCKPSRATTFTSALPAAHGLYTNHVGTPRPLKSFLQGGAWAARLRASGWRTAHYGKDHVPWGLGPLGFSEESSCPQDLWHNAARTVRQAQAAGQPWLVVVSTWAPHAPWRPQGPPAYSPRTQWSPTNLGGPGPLAWPIEHRWAAESSEKVFAQQGSAEHEVVARQAQEELRDELDRVADFLALPEVSAQVPSEAYVLLTSDNGNLRGQHGLWYKPAAPYQEMVRVPMLAAGPGVPAASSGWGLVGLADLGPTVLELAGLPHSGYGGQSFAPQLTASAPPAQDALLPVQSAVDETGGAVRAFLSLDGGRPEKLVAGDSYPSRYVDLASDAHEVSPMPGRGTALFERALRYCTAHDPDGLGCFWEKDQGPPG